MHEAPAAPEVLEDLSDYDINKMYIDLAVDFLQAVNNSKPGPTSLASIADGLHCTKLFEQIDIES